MQLRHQTLLTGLALAVVACVPAQAQVDALPATVPTTQELESVEALPVAPYDMNVVNRALEAQAWTVLLAAHEYAVANDGMYPEEIEQFESHLPRGERMQNLLTGSRDVPRERCTTPLGSIVYYPIVWKGHIVACQVTAISYAGKTIRVVSDDGWWRRVNEESTPSVVARR